MADVFKSEDHKQRDRRKLEDDIRKTILFTAINTLRKEGFDVRQSREGEIVVTKNYGRGQRWEHRFSLSVYANHL